jgi:hypothetical protein
VGAIFFSELIVNSPSDSYWVFYGFLFLNIFSTAYSYYWDLYMDWGFFRSEDPEKRFLRHKLLYPKKFYYIAAITNLIMRLMWLLPFFKYTYR